MTPCGAVEKDFHRRSIQGRSIVRAFSRPAAIAGGLALLVAIVALPPDARAQCAGDCDDSGRVSVNELIGGVRVALERAALQTCPSFDINGNGRVAVNELIAAVGNALNGCGFAGNYEAAVALDDGSSAEIELHAASNRQITGTLRLVAAESAQLAQAGSGNLSGSFDPVSGSFLVTGTVSGPNGTISIRLSGQLGAGFTLEVNGQPYISAFTPRRTPTPTLIPTPQGTVHVIKVGQAVLPFDPEVLEINPGETVTWMWVGGPHSVRSAVLNAIDQPSCTPSGLFDSGVLSSGSFSYTFTTPGRYGFHCAVGDHCASNFEYGYIDVRGTPTATPTRTFTASPTFAVPTPTPTPETIHGVSTKLIGTFSGLATILTNTYPARLQITVDDFGVRVFDLSASPFIFPNPVTMTAQSPTELLYNDPGPPPTTLTLSLDDRMHVLGRYTVTDPIMPHLPIDFDLTRQP